MMAGPNLRIGKQERLRRSREFRAVYMRGRRLSGPHLSLSFLPNQLNFSRLGLSVGKKRFKLSVRRHYLQRCLREVYRLNKMCFLPGYDIIITALKFNQGKTNFADINKELLALVRKAGLLKR